MTVDEIVKVVRDLGFPVAVAIFLLWRLEARLKELTGAIDLLAANCGLCRPQAPWDGRERRKPTRPEPT